MICPSFEKISGSEPDLKWCKGNTLVMVLALIVVFSTMSIALSDLITTQSVQVEYLLFQSKVRYISHSGLLHMEQEMTEDIDKTVSTPISFEYVGEYCVAWTIKDGIPVCDTNAIPSKPCCEFRGSACVVGNTQGRCKTPGKWVATYKSLYDSTSKSITSTGCVVYVPSRDTNADCFNSDPNAIQFKGNQSMILAWE
ncbi:hypothetical protein HOF92_08025 [bacterium]|nr:hypothetical protein [bacterium]